ncbi:MAG: T9SS type B sorting domain-containing protein, partial [Flavobacteriaceae bacterium]|nr:T9SS type B sorting domain-containing protein [Flavobacteriaceae bacterium]
HKFSIKTASGDDIPTRPCSGLELFPRSKTNTEASSIPLIDYTLKINKAGDHHYQPWESIAIDLSDYIGQTLSLEFEHFDCNTGYHGSYSYFSAAMRKRVSTVYFCRGATETTLKPYIPNFTSYLWNTGADTKSLVVNNPVDGAEYTCVVESYNSCSTTLTYVLREVITEADFSYTSDNNVCNPVQFQDTSVVRDTSNNKIGEIVEWQWDFGDPDSGDKNSDTVPNPEHSYANPGSYTVTLTVTDSFGCTDTISHEIEVIDRLTPEFDLQQQYCRNSSGIELPKESQNGITGVWDTSVVDTSTIGTKIYTFTPDKEFCANEFTLTIVVNPIPELTIETSDLEICAGENITLNVASNGVTVNWYASETEETPLSTGNSYNTDTLTETTSYWVEAINTEGCVSGRIEVKVTVHPIPELTIETTDLEICAGENITLSVISNSATVNWYASETEETPLFIGNPYITDALTEDTSYWVEAVSAEGCVSERIEIKVTVYPIPELTIETSDLEICAGENITLNVASDGVIVNWYASKTEKTPLSTGNSYTTDILTKTTSYWVEAVSSEGCVSGRIEITVTVYPIPELIIETKDLEICIGENITLSVFSNGATVYWYASETEKTPLFIGNPYITAALTEDTSYWVEAINTGGCVSERIEIKVTVHPIPELTIETKDLEICAGENITLNASSDGATVYWYASKTAKTPLSGGNSYTTATLMENTSYWVEAINAGGCVSERIEITIKVHPLPDLDLQPTLTICPEEPQEVEVPSGFESYTWTDEQGNVIGTKSIISFAQEGTYKLAVTVKDLPCSIFSYIKVSFYEAPQITNIDVNGSTATINATGTHPLEYSLDQVSWQSSPIFSNLEHGIHTVYVRSKNGCTLTSKTFGVLSIPNAITPNGDGYNDTWEIHGIIGYPDAEIQIFDRHGKLIYGRKIGTDFRWDGKYNGQKLASNTYWYIITLDNGEKLTGYISVKNQ